MDKLENTQTSKVAVIGDGWTALGSVASLISLGRSVVWIQPGSARFHDPLPTLEQGVGAEFLSRLGRLFSDQVAFPDEGLFLREFRNKAFRDPFWRKAPSAEARTEVIEEGLWGPEKQIIPQVEARLGLSTIEIEEAIRAALVEHPLVQGIAGVPVEGFESHETEKRITHVCLSSGEKIEIDEVIYADRWSGLGAIDGLPKPLPFNRGRDPMGVLQVTFTHSDQTLAFSEMGNGVFAPINRDAGEEQERHIWGYFFNEGKKSLWTVFLSSTETEDNHEIAKKLRRMKQALEKMFGHPDFLPEGVQEFSQTVIQEQVAFSEGKLFAQGQPIGEPVSLPKFKNLSFLTDGYGSARAWAQVASLFQAELEPLFQEREKELAAQEVDSDEGQSTSSQADFEPEASN